MLPCMYGQEIANVARLIANPTSARVLDALLSDRELSVGVLAAEIHASPSAVSEAVSALADGGLVLRRTEGRRTIVRLAGDEVAEALEALGRLSRPARVVGLRSVSRMQALRHARTCYDHLAGELGVALTERLLSAGVLEESGGEWRLSVTGRSRLVALDVDPDLIDPRGRRPLVLFCADWTENQPHLSGRLGAAICRAWLDLDLVCRLPGSRAVEVMPAASSWLARLQSDATHPTDAARSAAACLPPPLSRGR
jgi:DNA-binding transcriptional ArsR family regulator